MAYTQFMDDAMTAYLIQSKAHAGNWELKRSLRSCKACETMRSGYEFMAQINLDFCELGLTDCLSALREFENKLNGEDTNSDC